MKLLAALGSVLMCCLASACGDTTGGGRANDSGTHSGGASAGGRNSSGGGGGVGGTDFGGNGGLGPVDGCTLLQCLTPADVAGPCGGQTWLGEEATQGCTFRLDALPSDPMRVSVVIGCEAIDAFSCGNGSWTLDAAAATLTLTGPACDQVQADPTVRVFILFGCPGPIPS
jgi:hypothetical protein